jgi:hypothetical protein
MKGFRKEIQWKVDPGSHLQLSIFSVKEIGVIHKKVGVFNCTHSGEGKPDC